MAGERIAPELLAWLPQGALLGLARALPYRARLGFAAMFLRTAVAVVPDLRGGSTATSR